MDPRYSSAAKARSGNSKALAEVSAAKTHDASSEFRRLLSSTSDFSDESVKSAMISRIFHADRASLEILCEAFPHIAGSLQPSTISETLGEGAVATSPKRPEKALSDTMAFCLGRLGASPSTDLLSRLFRHGEGAADLLLDLSTKNENERLLSLVNSLSKISRVWSNTRDDGASVSEYFIRHACRIKPLPDCRFSSSSHAGAFREAFNTLLQSLPGKRLSEALASVHPDVLQSLAGRPLGPKPLGDIFSRSATAANNSERESFRKIRHGHPHITPFEHSLRLGDIDAAISMADRGLDDRSRIVRLRQVHNPQALLFAKEKGADVEKPLWELPGSVEGSFDEEEILSLLKGPAPANAPSRSKLVASWGEGSDPSLHVLLGLHDTIRQSRTSRSATKGLPEFSVKTAVDLIVPLAEAGLCDPAKGLEQLRRMSESLGEPFEMLGDSVPLSSAFENISISASIPKPAGSGKNFRPSI